MARKMTYTEFRRFKRYFPYLSNNIVTAEATQVYNCIAWSVGITNTWLWPGQTLADFNTFYSKFNLYPSAEGSVAAWGFSQNDMKHGSKISTIETNLWESKCGEDLQILHSVDELRGYSYGQIISFYSKSLTEETGEKLLNLLMKEERFFNDEELELLNEEIGRIPNVIRIRFERNFEFWKRTWFRGMLSIDSNPRSRTGYFEFFRLLSMGEQIIPLVVAKLIEPDNFFALQLYERLQQKPNLLTEINVNDDLILEGEQGRAYKTVKKYFSSK